MAKKKTAVTKEPASQLPKTMGLFEHINNVRTKKTPWNDLSEADQKSWSTYMVNRFISMNPDYLDLINQLQKYTIGILDNGITQRLYCEVLPYDKSFHKYVKGANESKFSTELISIVRKHFMYSSAEAEEYVQMIVDINPNELFGILKRYGKTEKEIEKMF